MVSNALRNSIKTQNTTPQTQKAKPNQVVNNAGGFVFQVSDVSRLERFLILGTDGGTYYVGEQKHTEANVKFLKEFIARDERRFVDTVVDVSVNGRAYKNSPALFAIALVLTEGKDKAYAREAFQKVVRTSTHLFEVAEYVDGLGGWGRAKRAAFAGWYESKGADQLAYQAVKYRQRNGWTHKDVLRLSHAKPDSQVASFMVGKGVEGDIDILRGFQAMQNVVAVEEVIRILDSFKNLPWETIPTQFLTDARVWKTLFYNGQLTGQALIRNITRLAKNGAFKDMQFAADYAAKLNDEEMIAKSRLHPVNYLNTIVVYSEGQVDRQYGYRKLDWTPEGVILDALNDGFHTSFKTVTPAGKRTLLAVDVSGSMSSPAMGLDLSCAQVSGALAMTIARTEPAHVIRGFTSSGGGWYNRNSELTDLGISAKSSLNDAMRKVQKSNFGGTDCSLPMTWALENKVEVDTFAVVTDSETWAGKIHPHQALKQYRDKMGINAKLAVFGVAGSPFTIADPSDTGRQMDFVGFDSAAPRVFADFSAGRL
jgi:60 kDa SS-A/Ro ribonucleoprotein